MNFSFTKQKKYFKIFLFAALVVQFSNLSAAELFKVDLRSPESVKKHVGLGCDRKQAAAAFEAVSDGARCTVTQPGKSIFAVEFYVHGKASVIAGNQYKLKFRVKSDRPAKFNASCYLNLPNWTVLSREASRYIDLPAERWTDVEFAFTAAIDAADIRMPSLRLGQLPAGSTVTIQSASLEGPDQVKQPAITFGNVSQIQDFSQKIDRDLESAWKKQTPARKRFSLSAYWKFTPTELPAETEACYLLIPGSWRGANATGVVRNAAGKPVAAINGKKVEDYEIVNLSRTFFIPAEWSNQSIRLKCDYLHADTEVLVNGRKAGKFGADDDFIVDCELAPFLKFGAENQLTLQLKSTAKRGQIRGGILDAIWLDVLPKQNFGVPIVETRISQGKTLLRFLKPTSGLAGELKIAFRDAQSGEIVETQTLPYQEKLSFDYVAPKLWDVDHPNLYFLELTLTDKAGKILDAEKIRIGFRELTINGKDYLLNGKPIRLICASTCMNADWECGFFTSPDTYRNRLLTLKKLRHNSGYVARSEQSVVYEVADEVGFLMMPEAFILPYREQEQLDDTHALAKIRQKLQAAAQSERYHNHPSLAIFVTDVWFNLHPGSHNPEYIGIPRSAESYVNFDKDGNLVPGTGADPNVTGMRLARQKRLEKINTLYDEFFPGTLAITGGSGQVGQVYSTHLYHTWGAPVHELRALCQRYAQKPSIPLFIGEMNIPYPLSFYYPIMTPDQKRPMYYENAVRFFGNRAYRYPAVTGNMHSVLFEQRESDGKRSYSFVSSLYTEILSLIMRNTMSAWRYQGLNGVGPFGYAVNSSFLMGGVTRNDRLQPIPNTGKSPWIQPEFLSRGAAELSHSHTGTPDMRPAPGAAEFLAAWNPVALDIFGAGKDIWETDHAFYGNETVRKNVAVMNDLHEKRSFELRLSLCDEANNRITLLSQPVEVESFSSMLIPVEFQVPDVFNRSEFKLTAELQPQESSSREIARTVRLEVFPKTTAPRLKRNLFVFDPEGHAVKMLKSWGTTFTTITDFTTLPDDALLLIGRGGFSNSSSVPDLNTLTERGIRTLVLEQDQSSSMELMKVRDRYAFINVQSHPVLKGFTDRDFSLWRGSHARQNGYQIGSTGQSWTDWGNRNMVAGTVFRRPTQGNYRALLVSGFDLFQTPLLEYSGDRGSWIGCQLELSERLGSDPVPTELFKRLLAYLDTRANRDDASATAFLGGKQGRELLDQLKVKYRMIPDLTEKSLKGIHTLLIAAPDFNELAKYRFEINEFVHAGNRVIYLQCTEQFSPDWLPFTMRLEKKKFRNARAQSREGDGIWLAGYDDTDFAYEREYELPVFSGFPSHWDAYDPGILLRAPLGEGEFLFCSLTPQCFGKEYAAHKTARFLSALLTSAGVKIKTPGAAYMVQDGTRLCSFDLAPLAWQFSLDPQNIGLQENWQNGSDGSGKWITGQTADAREVRVGIPWEHFLGHSYDGVAWYRIETELPFLLRKSQKIYLNIGCVDDLDEVYVNGVKIGATGEDTPDYWIAPRLYSFDSKLLKPGKNRIVIRVTDLRGDGGIMKLPLTISNRPGVGGRAWEAPFLDKAERDYLYNPNVVRGY